MRNKVLFTALCFILITFLLTSCLEGTAKLKGYPENDLPLYSDAKVIEYEYDDDGKDIELTYGIQHSTTEVCKFYMDFFKENNMEVMVEESNDEYSMLGKIDKYIFEIEIENPSDKYKKKYKTIVEIELDYTGKVLISNQSSSDNPTPNISSNTSQHNDTEFHLIMGKQLINEKKFKGTNEYISGYSYGNRGITMYELIEEKDCFVTIGRTDSTDGDITRKFGGHYDGDLGQDAFGDVFVVKFNKSLEIMWIQYFSYENIDPDTASDDYPLGLKALPDGTYEVSTLTTKGEIVGQPNEWDYGDTVETISLLTSDGEITSCEETEHQYTMQGTLASYESSDGITVWTLTEMIDFESSGYYVVKAIDTPSGKLLWLNTYPEMQIANDLAGFHTLTMNKYNELYDDMYDTQGLWDDGENKAYQITNMRDALVVKLDNNGVMQWHRYCGGTGDDTIYGACEMHGKYYFKAYTASMDGDVAGYVPEVEKLVGSTDVIDYRPVLAPWYFTLDEYGELEESTLYKSDYDIHHNNDVALLDGGYMAVLMDNSTIHIYK